MPIASTPSSPYSVNPATVWIGGSQNPNPNIGVGKSANWIFPYKGNPGVPDKHTVPDYWPQALDAPSYQDFPPGNYNYSIQWSQSAPGTLTFYGATADNSYSLYLDSNLIGNYPSNTNFQSLQYPAAQPLSVGSHKLTAIVQNSNQYTGLLVIAAACPTTSGCASINGAELVAWWKLDELPGATSVADSSGNSNNGVPEDANGAPTSISSSPGPPSAGPVPVTSPPLNLPSGVVGSALYFYGPYLEVPSSALPSSKLNFGTGSFTIDGWVWPVQVGPTQVSPIVDKRDISLASGYALYVQGGKLNLIVNNILYSSSSSTIPFGTWTHVTVAFDTSIGSGVFYINGGAAGPITPLYSPSSVINTLPLWIGKSRMTGVGFGEIGIDDLEIWGRPLSQNEIQTIYSAGSAGKCPTSATATTVTTWDTEKTISTTTAINQSTTTQTIKTETTITGTFTVVAGSTTTWTSETGSPVTITTTVTNSSTSVSCIPGTTNCTTITITNSTSTYTYTVTRYVLTSSTSTILTSYTATLTSTQSGGATITQTITSSSTITTTYLSHLTTLTSTLATTSTTCEGTPGAVNPCASTTTLPPTSTNPPSGPKCIIATAAYGSELAAPVQFLRNFRDGQVHRTYLGSQFLVAFNSWYYSWAPAVAQQEAVNGALRSAVRAVILPLLGTLFVAQQIFTGLTPLSPELAILVAGFSASAMLGVIYLTPIMYLTQRLTRTRLTRRRLFYAGLLAAALALLATLSNGVSGLGPSLTSIFVLESMILTPLALTRKLANRNISSK